MILADWQANEEQEGLSGIKVLQRCVCCLDASDIGGEGGPEVGEVSVGGVLGSSEKVWVVEVKELESNLIQQVMPKCQRAAVVELTVPL